EQDLQTAVQASTQSLRTEMHERQTAQDALQTYNHTINHDLRNLVMGVSMVVQGVLRQAANTHQPISPPSESPASESPVSESPASESAVTIEPTALTLIQKSCDRQLNLMNSLVEVRSAEIWRTVLHTQPLELQTLTTELSDTYTAKFQTTTGANPKFTLTIHIPPTLPHLQADPSQLKRVFENLINNALKYNPDGVDITISATVENHTIIRCSVADNGIGIHTTDTQDLFKIYARGQTDRKILGDGVGLYICRQIINAHGGNIGIEPPKENSQGHNDENSSISGATFWFTLPIRQ
ncbi:MAG: HAMP domain-containing sensor histidine kinase, partial [Cyanobacteria bacterium J06598_3]